jgi:DNA-binding response OmpR family regulator
MAAPRVAVLADDLIWSTRLVAHLRQAGAEPVPVHTLDALLTALPTTDAVVVDLTALRYDGLDAIAQATAGGRRVIAVGQHDDVELRKKALAAGAERVYAYRKLFEDGPKTLGPWLTLAVAGR